MTESKTILLPGGEAHYFAQGLGDPLILLHGVPGDARVWRYNLDVLALNFRVLALDLPAWGRSTRANGFESSLEGLAAHVLDFSQALGLDAVSLAGNGAGAAIALQFALDHRTETRALVLSGAPMASAAEPLNVSPPSGFVAREAYKRVAKGTMKRLFQEGYAEPRHVDSSMVDAFARSLGTGAALTALAELHESLVARLGALESELSRIEAPALIVHGGKDRFCSRDDADRLASLLPNAVVAPVEQAGHFCHEENPAGYNNVVLDYLRRALGVEGGA